MLDLNIKNKPKKKNRSHLAKCFGLTEDDWNKINAGPHCRTSPRWQKD